MLNSDETLLLTPPYPEERRALGRESADSLNTVLQGLNSQLSKLRQISTNDPSKERFIRLKTEELITRKKIVLDSFRKDPPALSATSMPNLPDSQTRRESARTPTRVIRLEEFSLQKLAQDPPFTEVHQRANYTSKAVARIESTKSVEPKPKILTSAATSFFPRDSQQEEPRESRNLTPSKVQQTTIESRPRISHDVSNYLSVQTQLGKSRTVTDLHGTKTVAASLKTNDQNLGYPARKFEDPGVSLKTVANLQRIGVEGRILEAKESVIRNFTKGQEPVVASQGQTSQQSHFSNLHEEESKRNTFNAQPLHEERRPTHGSNPFFDEDDRSNPSTNAHISGEKTNQKIVSHTFPLNGEPRPSGTPQKVFRRELSSSPSPVQTAFRRESAPDPAASQATPTSRRRITIDEFSSGKLLSAPSSTPQNFSSREVLFDKSRTPNQLSNPRSASEIRTSKEIACPIPSKPQKLEFSKQPAKFGSYQEMETEIMRFFNLKKRDIDPLANNKPSQSKPSSSPSPSSPSETNPSMIKIERNIEALRGDSSPSRHAFLLKEKLALQDIVSKLGVTNLEGLLSERNSTSRSLQNYSLTPGSQCFGNGAGALERSSGSVQDLPNGSKPSKPSKRSRAEKKSREKSLEAGQRPQRKIFSLSKRENYFENSNVE